MLSFDDSLLTFDDIIMSSVDSLPYFLWIERSSSAPKATMVATTPVTAIMMSSSNACVMFYTPSDDTYLDVMI